MHPLDIIVVYSNPIRWTNRRERHREFEDRMLDEPHVRLHTVELVHGEREHELCDRKGVNRIRVRANTLVWTKENCANIALSRLPADCRYVGLADGDIAFRRSGWAMEAIHHMQHFHVIQPWQHCYDLGPNDEHLEPVHHSFLKEWSNGNPMTQGIDAKRSPYRFGHCGYFWIWTKQALEWVGGFLEIAALGAGDHHMALALIGKAHTSLPGFISDGYRRHVFAWQSRAQHHINMRLSYMPWTIEHSWHGRKEHRKYVSRWDILKRHKFDPDTDLKRNCDGVLELVGNKPMLMKDIHRYFADRNEDCNSVD